MSGLNREKKRIIVAIALVLCLSSASLIVFQNQASSVTNASSIHAPIIP